MLEAAQLAQQFTAGRERADLDRDVQLVLALCRCIEIIGEAASKVSEETKAALAGLPWREMVAMRNRLIHAYFDVDLRLLWETAENDIPSLVAGLPPIIGSGSSDAGSRP